LKKVKIIILSLFAAFIFGAAFFIGSCSKDKCNGVNCHSGTCSDGTCSCPAGFSGTDCSNELRVIFFGEYTAMDSCFTDSVGAIKPYIVEIATSSASGDRFTFSNIKNTNIQFYGAVSGSGTDFTIPTQQINYLGSTVNVSGSGSINSDHSVIKYSYTISNNGASQTCANTLTRK